MLVSRVIKLILIASILLIILIAFLLFDKLPPDKELPTSPQVIELVNSYLTNQYRIKSINSVLRTGEFEDTTTKNKWLIIKLDVQKRLNSELSENIEAQICKALAQSSGNYYDGVEILPSDPLSSGLSCSIWGP